MNRVLVVGAGVTGSVTCALLKRMSVAKEVVVWEKSRGVGGRMSSSGTRTGECVVDLGAQYVTATKDYVAKHGDFYEELTAAGVLKEMEAVKIVGERHKPGDTNFVAPAGMASIAKHFIEKSEASVEFGRRARSVEKNEDGTTWTVTDEDGDSSNFDAVILTQPTPQILDMVGAAGVPSDVIAELGNVEYSSRFALAVYYDGDNIGYDSMLEGVNAKYISGEPIVRFVALGNLKTDGKSSPGSKLSVVVHTSGPFGTDNLEASKEEMGPVMEKKLRELFPTWPQSVDSKPHKWRYSQVSRPYTESPGCISLSDDPAPLIAAGDAFTHSNFDGCVASAEAVVARLIKT